ncbi:hypothetical protein CO115_01115 [Candidatus Falkowbacteria bacterium CG_4_9_14_3_um_filter_36_9]|uniref:Helix-turn-helix domain-containing protein n=2 Tax=Candidatus Falkowiibacteriota TaxID=1752728 RepID=A0A1J4TAY7_9BACT|nr:MAG: hypothetical protein AUJ27_00140 [Candidatus Falkowbacteria bacterium CG1_02_37_44]PIV51981.1 MAG: hypothetical protein COS18_01065 [Candidatus Falkowbacteria bacterium CG02_land_8_20_14_3_00_36_14]PIX10813.1 MAG: hypothetical protein COZ73_04530 [Candidatus Falkowbacteria bacterium CG_4_8_14_3_um_filter_36_11]PJA11314.1 MAG: hypothetical protein COX67_00365 [Candidatus Falkowbacteria bacterium CG_4_10_14_0_2_um_filter_36_22]PJB20523.1 MAG: hypothetical protein CO115_01115 [Candidatus F
MDLKSELKQLNETLNNKEGSNIKNSSQSGKRKKNYIFTDKPKRIKKHKIKGEDILNKSINNPVWLSVSEAAKIGGVQNKTIRRAIQSRAVKYKVKGNRYLIEITSIIKYLYKKTKLKNKFNDFGIGQYVEKWEE